MPCKVVRNFYLSRSKLFSPVAIFIRLRVARRGPQVEEARPYCLSLGRCRKCIKAFLLRLHTKHVIKQVIKRLYFLRHVHVYHRSVLIQEGQICDTVLGIGVGSFSVFGGIHHGLGVHGGLGGGGVFFGGIHHGLLVLTFHSGKGHGGTFLVGGGLVCCQGADGC